MIRGLAAKNKSHEKGIAKGERWRYFCVMQVKKLCDLKAYEVGVIERVDTPEEVMALVQMGCCIGSEVEVKHIAPLNGPMAICTCGRTLAVRKEAAAHLWVRVATEQAEVA
jgi:Fe2+ transport system protein FeoA